MFYTKLDKKSIYKANINNINLKLQKLLKKISSFKRSKLKNPQIRKKFIKYFGIKIYF